VAVRSQAPEPETPEHRRTCLLCTIAGILLALLWQFLTVQYNFGGNWTGLFYTGERWPPPPVLAAERVLVFPETAGYDGQFYHYAAHDPLLHRGFEAYTDNARVRWRRILIPGLAHLGALGNQRYVDRAYFVVVLGFLFLGIYCLSSFCVRHGLHASLGLSFLLVPAVTISIERMTVDIALAALAVGFALWAEQRRQWAIYAAALLAPLARETGLLLAAGCVLAALSERQWKRTVVFSTAAIPCAAWAAYVHAHTQSSAPVPWMSVVPFAGIWGGVAATLQLPLGTPDELFRFSLHALAFMGLLLALFFAGRLVWQRRSLLGPVEWAAGLYVLLAMFLAYPEVWADSYAYARVMSPLLLWLAMFGFAWRRWWLALPLALAVPRIAAHIATYLPGIWRGITGV
jgi:hypothetical protein